MVVGSIGYNDPQLMAGGISKDNISRLTLAAVIGWLR